MIGIWNRWWFAIISALVLLEEGLSGISRGAHGKSDLGVFYRTAVLLAHGAGGALYVGRDEVLGWYRCIPPAGMMWFAPLSGLSPRGASVVWILFNFALAGVGFLALRAVMDALEHEGDGQVRAALPFATGLFFLMAAPSVEVGQFSLMFVALWLVALWCAVRHRFEGTALALALPVAIKIYPLLLLMAPLGVLRVAKWPRFLLAFGLGCAFWTWGAPSLFYGGRTAPLESAFWQDVVLSPNGRLSESQNLRAFSNHGLDAVMLRFGSDSPEPAGSPPHLHLAPSVVLRLVNPVRALFLVAAVLLWWRRERWRGENEDAHLWFYSAALWSATLFLILPGAKARYAVYAFIGFLPLVLHLSALFQSRAAGRWFYLGLVMVATLLVISLVPSEARIWGAGFWGALIVWVENGRLLMQRRGEGIAAARSVGEAAVS